MDIERQLKLTLVRISFISFSTIKNIHHHHHQPIIDNMDKSPFDLLFQQSVPHILEKIFLNLDYDSFKSCLLVNETWRNLVNSEPFKRMGKSKFEEWLLKAASAGQADAVHHLLQLGAEPNIKGKGSGRTPLHWAAILNKIDIVRLLLDAGADPNSLDILERSPLYYSRILHNRTSMHIPNIVVNMLLDSGADPKLME